MWNRSRNDVELGLDASTTIESPDLRWSLVSKLYVIMGLQLFLTLAVGSVVVSYQPIITFLTTTKLGFSLYILVVMTPIITLLALSEYYHRNTINYLLLGILMVSLAFSVGLSCAFTTGKILLEAVILRAVVVMSFAVFTYWTAKRGVVFNMFDPFLFSTLIVLTVFFLIQIFFPLGKISMMIYGFFSAITYCGYVVYDANKLMSGYPYDDF